MDNVFKEYQISDNELLQLVSKEVGITVNSVEATVGLSKEGSTVPFIARYRKDRTGALDEVAIRSILDKHEEYTELAKRKAYILNQINSQKKLTPELQTKIVNSWNKVQIEDLFLPYKPKKKTKGSQALEKGLGPMADVVWAQEMIEGDPNLEAGKYISEAKGVKNLNDVFQGVISILGERISDQAVLRQKIREVFLNEGIIKSEKSSKFDGATTKFDTYFDYKEKVSDLLKEKGAHRYLAINRGEKEKVLTVTLDITDESIISLIKNEVIKNPKCIFTHILEEACGDAYSRLIKSSLTNEMRSNIKSISDEYSVNVFSKNLKTILLAPPFGGKRIVAIDPAFKTGCKIVALNETGDFLENTTIYPHEPQNEKEKSEGVLIDFIKRYQPKAIVIGNGTASRETDSFIRELLDKHKELKVFSMVVSESGASVYSASELAREEFPDLDVTVKGAISIGRRFQDPLAELVKIDPKSIGVGQYQHDVNQTKLKKSLDAVITDCVNYVGVDVNTASKELLSYISGVGPSLANNIVEFRKKNKITNREVLKNVSRFTEKVYQQAVGFLRILDGDNVLDNTGIHPEAYEVVYSLQKKLNKDVNEIVRNLEVLNTVKVDDLVNDEIGPLTAKDILEELKKPGRDPRRRFLPVKFTEGVKEITDLKENMFLNGIVTNVTNFGVFVDVGVHTDGLVHTSELTHKFVSDPSSVFSVGDHVKVMVLGVDLDKKQVSLSIKAAQQEWQKEKREAYQKAKSERKPRSRDYRGHQNNFRKGDKKKFRKDRKEGRQQSLTSNPFAALGDLMKK